MTWFLVDDGGGQQRRSGLSLLVPICAMLAQLTAGCAPKLHSSTSPSEFSQPGSAYPVAIHGPAGAPSILTGTVDEKGRPVSVACATCHATRPPAANAKLGAPLAQFHQNLSGKHGDLACVSCHNPEDGYSSLRLADGRSLRFTDVMALCAQCHGPQFRDYQHGAHGGMTGYWDLTKGGRTRNNCIDCHDPHVPKYPTVTPARGPNDRFQPGDGHE